MANPVKYTSRTYRSILTDINSDPELADKPAWWKRIWAGVGDTISVWLNAQANNMYLETAFTREAVTKLCQLIDYELSPQRTSSGAVLFYLANSATFPFTIAAADLKATTQGTINQSSIRFESRNSVNVSEVSETFTADDSTDEFTVARDYTTGEKVSVSSTGTLPSPLSDTGEYYVIRVDATTIKLAQTAENAYAGNEIDITSTGSGTHTVVLRSVSVQVYQQRSVDQYVAGESDGITAWQEIGLRDRNILLDTIEVIINGITWTRVSTFVNSQPSDKHYEVIYRTDNSAFLRFGDGSYGQIPGNFEVNVSYAVGGGVESNIASANRINIYAGSNTNVTGASNPASITGGTDRESIETAKRLAPLLLKARDRFVTSEDGEILAQEQTGAALVQVNKNVFGTLSAQVLVVAPGGGNLSSGAQSTLQTYLTERTLLEEADIRVEDVTFITSNVTADVNVSEGYAYADIEPYVDLAIRLIFDETGQEIKDEFTSNGLENAVTLINSIFATSFDSTDYGPIRRLLESLEPAQFGTDIQRSSVEGYIDAFVEGVNYIIVNTPSFPISIANDEVSSVGNVTLTEV